MKAPAWGACLSYHSQSAFFFRNDGSARRESAAKALLREQALVIHPFQKKRNPARHRRRIRRAHTKAMANSSVNMQFGRHMGTRQREIELRKTLRDIRPVVRSTSQKGGRSLGGNPRVLW